MVISPYNAAVSPYTMPPCSCASIWPTFTVDPQSTAHTPRCTRTDPSAPTDTSATCAHTVGAHSAMAMPRPCPLGRGEPQPAFSAASSSVRRCRGLSCSNWRRSSKGSCFAAAATSSKKHSVTNAFCDIPTERQKPRGTGSKSAAQERRVDAHPIFGESGELGRHLLRPGLVLRGGPYIAAVRAHVRRAVHRLHGGVVQERHLVHRLHSLRRAGERSLRVAGLACLHPRLLGEPGELGANAVGAERGGLAPVPLDLQGAPPLHGVSVGIGDHRDA